MCPQDVGAFYTCGQGGKAFWNGRGSKVFNNTFRNIRNTAGTGVQAPSVQALYLTLANMSLYRESFVMINWIVILPAFQSAGNFVAKTLAGAGTSTMR